MPSLPALCGDGVLDPLEGCDDGNTSSGDGCFATCDLEGEQALFGTADGGTVEVVVDGVAIAVPTISGQSAIEVLDALVAEIAADATLQLMGTTAIRVGNRLVVSGALTAATIADSGLAETPLPVPALGLAGLLVASALLVAARGFLALARGA